MTQQTVRVLEIRTPYLNDLGYLVEIWWAAIDDPDEAISRVREASNSSHDIEILMIGTLTTAAAAAVSLPSGSVRSAS